MSPTTARTEAWSLALAQGVAQPLAPDAGLQFWRIDLEAAAALPLPSCLSAAEAARTARLRFDLHRRRFIGARSALRWLLADALGTAPAAVALTTGPEGKPRLADRQAPAFNLSHSEGVGLIVLAPQGEVGVDVEHLRAVDDCDELAAAHFSPAEQAALARRPESRRGGAFLRAWTRKEACLKALGAGLTVAACRVDAGVESGAQLVAVPAEAGGALVEVRSLQAGAGLIAAWARVLAAEPALSARYQLRL